MRPDHYAARSPRVPIVALTATATEKVKADVLKILGIDKRCNLALQEALGGPDRVVQLRSPVTVAKAIKNETELQGFRNCHLRDAAALVLSLF